MSGAKSKQITEPQAKVLREAVKDERGQAFPVRWITARSLADHGYGTCWAQGALTGFTINQAGRDKLHAHQNRRINRRGPKE